MKGLSRKCLSVTLTVCMVFTMTMSAFAASFTDVPSSHWAHSYVQDVVNKGLFTGMSDTTFEPETAMSRAMFVRVLSNLDEVIGSISPTVTPEEDAGTGNDADTDTADDADAADAGDGAADSEDAADTTGSAPTQSGGGGSNFTDVAAGAWYADAVTWAARNSIVSGLTTTTFGPDDPVTREQMVSLIVRYAEYANISLNPVQAETPFSDASSITSYARTAVTLCQRVGLISGMGDGRFAPQGTATRAEVAVVMSKLYVLASGGTLVDGDTYTVTFNSNGGSAVESQTVAAGGTVTRPANPTRSGYSFGGWYTDSALTEAYDFSTPVTSNFTLYARWTESSGGGGGGGNSGPSTYEVTYNYKNADVAVNGTALPATGHKASYSSGTTVNVAVSNIPGGYVLGSDSVKVNGNSVSVTEDSSTPGRYTFSFRVSSATVVDISPATVVTGQWNSQAVYVQPSSATAYTLGLPLEEIWRVYTADNTKTLTIDAGSPISALPTSGNAAVAIDPSGTFTAGDTSFQIGILVDHTTVPSFNDWNNNDITVVLEGTPGTTYNISLFASAAWDIKVGAGGTLKIYEASNPAGAGVITGGTSQYGVTDLDDTKIEISPDGNQAGVLTVKDYTGATVLPTQAHADEYTFAGTGATPVIKSVTYTVTADFQDKAKASINLGSGDMELVSDQYGGYLYVYVQKDDITSTTTASIIFPEALDGTSITQNSNFGAAVNGSNANALDVIFGSGATFLGWPNAELEVTAVSGARYYISFYESAVWDITVGANGTLIIFEDTAPEKAGVLDGPVTQIGATEVGDVTIILRPDAGYEVDSFTIKDTAAAVVADKDDLKPVNMYKINAGSTTYTVTATFKTEAAAEPVIAMPTFDGKNLYWEERGTMMNISLPLDKVKASTEGIELKFAADAAIVGTPAAGITATVNASDESIVTVNLASTMSPSDFAWDTSDLQVAVGTDTYDISFFAAAVWNMDVSGDGFVTTSERPGKESVLIGPANRSYYGELSTTTITLTPIAGNEAASFKVDGQTIDLTGATSAPTGYTVSAGLANGEIKIEIDTSIIESTIYDVEVVFN